jgi:hypothetical protein
VFEAKAFIKRVRIPGAQMMADGLEVGVFKETFHHPFAKPLASMIGMNDDIADPGERGVIGDAANEADLLSFVEQIKTDGVANGFFDHRTRAIVGPVSSVKQGANDIQIQPAPVVGQEIFFPTPLVGGPGNGRSLHEEQAEASGGF